MTLAFKLVTFLMVAVMGTGAIGSGAALASADSLPGETLYPVKLAVEEVRLSLAADPATQATETMAFVAERVEEIETLAAQGEPVPEEVVARLAQQMEQVVNQITQARPEDALALLAQFTEQMRLQQQVLGQIQAAGPDGGQPAVQTALQATERLYQAAQATQGDPAQFQQEYQHRGQNAPGPGQATATPLPTNAAGTPTSTRSCTTCTPDYDQERLRDRTPNPLCTPSPDGTCIPDQDQDRQRDQDRDPLCTPSPDGPCQTCTPQQSQDQQQTHDQVHTPAPQQTPASPGNHQGGGGGH